MAFFAFRLLMTPVLAVLPEAGVFVLAPGSFHGEEVSAVNGEEWLGLYSTPDGFSLEAVSLVVESVHDPVLDRNGETSGIRVSAPHGKPVLFLRSEGNVFIPGPVSPVLMETELLSNGDYFQLTDSEYLIVEGDSLAYSKDGLSQNICSVYENLYGEGASIFWAGDLDGDGLNDLIVNDCAHYNIFINYRVFLSTFAPEGELLGEVAEFMAIGC